MRFTSFLLTAVTVLLGFSSQAFAWNFTCSPKETKDLSEQTPNVLLMLDRSGSMGFTDEGNVQNLTCRLCQYGWDFGPVDSAADCPAFGTIWSVSDDSQVNTNSSLNGYTHSFTLTLPEPATHDMILQVEIQGDFGTICEWADVYADGVLVGQIKDGPNDCQSSYKAFEFTVPASAGTDGVVEIDIVTSPDDNDCDGASGPGNCHTNSSCDGVDAYCSSNRNRARIQLGHGQVYHGTQTHRGCGYLTKWDQAKSAIDALTLQSDGTVPQYAHFGLGEFRHNTSASVTVGCNPSNNGAIMTRLNSVNPSNATPTARAIRASYQSACVMPATEITRSQSGDVGTDPTNNGWDLAFTFTNVPTEDVSMTVRVEGDFNAGCEFAAVYVNGTHMRNVGSANCGGSSSVTFTVPAALVMSGTLSVLVDTRGSGEETSSPLPNCAASADGVQAHCSGANGAQVSITHTNNAPAPTAAILINDGQPTREVDGGTSASGAYIDAIVQACAHRLVAPMFIVGLGTGTHEDFNNILAAAAGTGSCAGGVDPCDDPANWEALAGATWDSDTGAGDNDGMCSGAIQAENRDDLLMALEAITARLVCTFNVNFFNSGYTSVPPDPTYDYDYLYVELYDTFVGAYQQVMHKDAASANPPGEGWEFTSDARRYLELTPHYCNNVQNYQYSEGSTHLACLCTEGLLATPCVVPDSVALGVCPDGLWACDEGTDWCEPETDCCEPGVPCDTGLLGVCADGVIVCDGPPLGTCVGPDPSAEICDALDNDCDGDTDEGLGGEPCTIVGGLGRCGNGLLECLATVPGTVVPLECVPFGAMPELCNGLDDDCDGDIDNMSVSWSKAAFSSIRAGLDDDGEAAACRFNDVCSCPNGPATHAGDDFDEFLAAYYPPVCECGEGLAPSADGPMSIGEPAATNSGDSAAACSTSGGSAGGAAVLFMIALVTLRRRR